jgi:hypothetical protein
MQEMWLENTCAKREKKGKHFSMYSHFYMFLLLSQGKGCKIK